MIKKTCAYLGILILQTVLSFNAYGSDILPSIKEMQITATTEFDSNTGIFSYYYKLANSKNSTGSIYRIEIDISKPLNGIALKKEGIKNGASYLKNTSDHVISMYGDKILYVGFPSAPSEWMAGITERKTAKWGASDETDLIKPGGVFSGFVLTSYGLPSIRELKAEPWIDVNDFYPNVDEMESDDEVKALLGKIKLDKENAAFKGKIIGPTAPPVDFKPVDFLNSIITMKHEAYKLGWIKNEGILKSLDAKLDNAKKDIEKGNTRSAKNTLKAFINEVEAQGCESYENCPAGKHLTSESYGLLKYNAQYLIEHL